MPRYEWRGSSPFRDNAHDRLVEQGDVVELSERIAAGHAEMVPVDAAEASDEADVWEQSELHDLEWSKLRNMAVDAETDEINGRSRKEEMIEYFSGMEK